MKKIKTCSQQRNANEMQEENYSKQRELNTINQKLLKRQQKYENDLKEILKLQDVKMIKEEREIEWKRLSAEIDMKI